MHRHRKTAYHGCYFNSGEHIFHSLDAVSRCHRCQLISYSHRSSTLALSEWCFFNIGKGFLVLQKYAHTTHAPCSSAIHEQLLPEMQNRGCTWAIFSSATKQARLLHFSNVNSTPFATTFLSNGENCWKQSRDSARQRPTGFHSGKLSPSSSFYFILGGQEVPVETMETKQCLNTARLLRKLNEKVHFRAESKMTI